VSIICGFAQDVIKEDPSPVFFWESF